MIEQQTSRSLIPDSILKKWDSMKELAKGLEYVEGVTCLVPETLDEVADMAEYLLRNQRRIIGFDAEATSTRPDTAGIVGLSFACDDDRGFYVPVGHSLGLSLPWEGVAEIVEPVLQTRLSMAGGKYDWQLLGRHGVDVKWGLDSQSMSRLLGEVDYGVGLKPTVARMFGERMIEFSDVISPGQVKAGKSFADIEVGLASLYAVPDAIYTRRVSRRAMRDMPPAPKQMLVRVEHEVMRIAGEMEWNGAPLDEDFLTAKLAGGRAITETLRQEAITGLKDVAERQGKARSEVPDDLNLNSAPQLRKVLFDVCGFEPVGRSKKTKMPSADRASIEKMAERDPEVDWVRRFRSAAARVHDLEEFMDFGWHEDGWFWIHASLTPTGTSTGRWSGSKPNLQNISKGTSVYESRKSTWEVAPRDAIAAPPGWHIVTADYSQIELRVAAGESQCRMWLDAFEAGHDVHSASASAIFNVPIEEVTSAQRARGKGFNFALLFGQEIRSTAQMLGVTLAEASGMQQAFWDGLPEVRSWVNGIHKFVLEHKYVETYFGRRRWLRGIDSHNKWVKAENFRESVNTIVQGTAADILKIGLMRAEPKWKELGAKLFLVVHDQYVWIVPETVAPDVFCREMDALINFDLPGYPEMVSDYGIGRTFGSLVEFPTVDAVPSEWAEVYEPGAGVRAASDEDVTILVEVDKLSMDSLGALVRLLEASPGDHSVVLGVRSMEVERPLDIRTALGPGDELKVRAVVGATARVSLV